MLKSWCPEWNPGWWMTDKCAAELRAIRDVFPGKEWHFTSSNSEVSHIFSVSTVDAIPSYHFPWLNNGRHGID